MSTRIVWLLPCALLGAGCATASLAPENDRVTPSEIERGEASANVDDDADVAAVLTAANRNEIESGRLAQQQATDPEVQAFATRMVTEHSAMEEQNRLLAEQLELKPEPNDASRRLHEMGAQSMSQLKGVSGAAFDRVYINSQVQAHEETLRVIDQTLIPRARNPEQRAMLEDARPKIVAHLEQAQQLQQRLDPSPELGQRH